MTLDRIIELSRQIAEECLDVTRHVDRTPFTPKDVGEMFGTILAQQMALAKAIEALAVQVKAGGDGSFEVRAGG
jgi:hypothetical protein